jgi:malic enzyme
MECELQRDIWIYIHHAKRREAYRLNKIKEDAINLHRALRGKIEIHNRVSIDATFGEEKGTLGLIYTPGVDLWFQGQANRSEFLFFNSRLRVRSKRHDI